MMTDKIDLDEKSFSEEVKRITSIFRDVLSIQAVEPSDNFFKLGGDSFDAIRAMSKLGIDAHVVTLFEHPTAETLARYHLCKAEKHSARLVPLNNASMSNASIAVICVPFGGGDPTTYHNLFLEKKDVSVYGVDFGDIEVEGASEFLTLVDTLAAQIKTIDADQFIIYGHCSGAATATCIASTLAPSIDSILLVVAAAMPIGDLVDARQKSAPPSHY